jgi:ribosomal protein L40E
VANQNTSDPIAGATIIVYLAQNGVPRSANFTGVTAADGTFYISLYVPAGLEGDYQVHASVTIGDKTTTSSGKAVTIKAIGENGVPWWVYLIILAGIAAVIIGFSGYLYKYGLGKMVECGECGALIPESSKRCPKCGVEFEVGTAKCSECGAWIPSNSASCPECSAKFITDAIEEEEDAYLKKMREHYEAYVDTFRDEARKTLGKKYSDGKFPDWWKKQPSYVSFENWLSQEEEKRKVGGSPCPSCGTLNPRGSTICHKCGSTLEMPKADALPGEESKAEGQQPKPLRRIVRRPVEKKPSKPEDKPAEEPKPEDNKPQN